MLWLGEYTYRYRLLLSSSLRFLFFLSLLLSLSLSLSHRRDDIMRRISYDVMIFLFVLSLSMYRHPWFQYGVSSRRISSRSIHRWSLCLFRSFLFCRTLSNKGFDGEVLTPMINHDAFRFNHESHQADYICINEIHSNNKSKEFVVGWIHAESTTSWTFFLSGPAMWKTWNITGKDFDRGIE